MSRKRHSASVIRTPVLILVLVGLLCFSSGLLSTNAQAEGMIANGRVPAWNAQNLTPPGWLDSVENPVQLYSEYQFPTLAGHLINFGVVTAPGCENGGLFPNGDATDCGMQAALPAMYEWQNRFNAAIVNTAQQSGVPAVILKNIFAWESQFWPETVYANTFEYGLGHLTAMGADSALRWYPHLYEEVCTTSFSATACEKDYVDQPDSMRQALQGAYVQRAEANCPGCRFNLDLEKAERSIPVFSQVVIANQNFVKKSFKNVTGKSSDGLIGQEDLWKFTLVSYNAGPNCYFDAFTALYYRGIELNWGNLVERLEPACRGSVAYVDFITKNDAYHPDHDPVLQPTATPTPADTPVEAATPSPTPDSPASDPLAAPHDSDEIVLKIDPEKAKAVQEALQGLNIDLEKDSKQIEPLGKTIVQVNPDELPTVLATLKEQPGILSAEPNYLVSTAGTPSDPEFSRQPNLAAIQVPQAWDAITDNQEVLVAVVDTGVDTAHPDLSGRLWQNPGEVGLDAGGNDMRSNGVDDDANGYVDDWQGWNVVAGNNNPGDDQGHGTHLAGIIGAGVDNATGIAGIAPNARILPVKVLDAQGQGTHAQVAEGIIYATDMGARIVNLGLAGAGSSETLQSAVNYALAHGVLVVAAAGNTGSAITNYPAGYAGVMAVSAVDNNGNWSAFSSQGSYISIAAPGQDIYSTIPGGSYQTASGTSMATAHVSGVAALLAGQTKFADLTYLRSALLNSALDLGIPGQDPNYGYGILQAYQTLIYDGSVLPTPVPTVVPTTTPGPVNAAGTDVFWASQQDCAAIVNPANSLVPPFPGAFDNQLAICAGQFAPGSGWTITDFALSTGSSTSTLSRIYSARLEMNFYLAGWEDDVYAIQLCTAADCSPASSNWISIDTFDSENEPPAFGPVHVSYNNLASYISTPAQANNAQMRIWGSAAVGGKDNVTIYLDQASLTFVDYPPIRVSITSPAGGASFAKGASISFAGKAIDDNDVDISSSVYWSWYSDIDGPISQTRSFSINTLTPGTHTITAAVSNGVTYSTNTSIIITVNPSIGPHGDFMNSPDGCAVCHRSHSEKNVASSISALNSNDFCLSCHSSGAIAVSTHSNIDSHFGNESVLVNQEAPFELLCVQCHDPHGGTGNLFAIRQDIRLGSLPAHFEQMPALPTPVIFTSLLGNNSFDENDTPESAANNMDDLCVACHASSNSPAYPTSRHAGGPNHYSGQNYAGQSCIKCHPHSSDGSAASKDGFMPVRGACASCHTTIQGVRTAAVDPQGNLTGPSHHTWSKVTDQDCEVCHDQSQHRSGVVRLFNADNHLEIYRFDGKNDATSYKAFCLSCHDADGASGNQFPFSDSVDQLGKPGPIDLSTGGQVKP